MYSSSENQTDLATMTTQHSAEGIAILTAQPSQLIRMTLYILLALLICALVWSFIGRADVIVQAQGRLGPEHKERLVYVPIKGQLVDLFVAEGMSINEGDTLARLNAIGAIQLAGQAQAALLKLREVQATARNYPLQKQSLEQYIKILEFQLETAQKSYELKRAEGLEKLAEEQRINLEKARLKVSSAKQSMEFAKKAWEKHQRLFNSPGGGGIARKTVEEKRKEYAVKQADYEVAIQELAEFEVKMGKEYAKKQKDLNLSFEQVISTQAQLAERKATLANGKSQIDAQLQQARAHLASVSKITFDDIDEDNFLRIRAPVSGVITTVIATQPGAEIEPKQPLVGIAPADARTVLHVEISERERAFLKEGMAVKLKFSAFPHQRFGFINGTLEHIAPNVTLSENTTGQNRPLVYKGRVSLQRHYITRPGTDQQIPLRYGMTATVEMVVRKRRLIDLALDPLRRATG